MTRAAARPTHPPSSPPVTLLTGFEPFDGDPLNPSWLIAQALQMGDEVHNRNAAASSLFLKKIVPAALHSGFDAGAAGKGPIGEQGENSQRHR